MAESMITFFNTADKRMELVSSLEGLQALRASKEGFYWLDLCDRDPVALTQALKTLGIEYSWMNCFKRPEILPHLSDTPCLQSFYLYDVLGSETLLDSAKEISQIEHAPILVMLGKDFVITYRQQHLDLIDFARKNCEENFKMFGKSPAFVVFLLIQHCLYHFSRLNLANDNFLDKIEYSVLLNRESEYGGKISIAGLNILTLKKLNANLHIILLVLVTKYNEVIGAEARSSFKDMLDNTSGIRASIDSSRDLLDSIVASIQAEAAQRTGDIVRVLTIISAVFMPMALVTGIYGMNFRIPELSWYYGYYMALGLMATFAGTFLFVLYYFGWIGKRKRK